MVTERAGSILGNLGSGLKTAAGKGGGGLATALVGGGTTAIGTGIGAGGGAITGLGQMLGLGALLGAGQALGNKAAKTALSPAALAIVGGIVVHILDIYVFNFMNGIPVIIINAVVAFMMLTFVFQKGGDVAVIECLLLYLFITSISGTILRAIGFDKTFAGALSFYIIGIVGLVAVTYIVGVAAQKIGHQAFDPRPYWIVGIFYFLQIGGIEALEVFLKLPPEWTWTVSQYMWPMWIILIVFFAHQLTDTGSKTIRMIASVFWLIIWIQMLILNLPTALGSEGIIEGPVSDANIDALDRLKEANPLKSTWAGSKCRFQEIRLTTKLDPETGRAVAFNYDKCYTEGMGLEWEEPKEDIPLNQRLVGKIDPDVDPQLELGLKMYLYSNEVLKTDTGIDFPTSLEGFNRMDRDVDIKLKCGIEKTNWEGEVVPDIVSTPAGKWFSKEVTCYLGQVYGLISTDGSKAYISALIEGNTMEARSNLMYYLIDAATLSNAEDGFLQGKENEKNRDEYNRIKSQQKKNGERKAKKWMHEKIFQEDIIHDFKDGNLASVAYPDFVRLGLEPEAFFIGIDTEKDTTFGVTVSLERDPEIEQNSRKEGKILGFGEGYIETSSFVEPDKGHCKILTEDENGDYIVNVVAGEDRTSTKYRYELDITEFNAFAKSESSYREFSCTMKAKKIPEAYRAELPDLLADWMHIVMTYDYELKSLGNLIKSGLKEGCAIGTSDQCEFGMPYDPTTLPQGFQAYISSWYGVRELGDGHHDGIDFAIPIGTAITAVYDGVVSDFCDSGWCSGYGIHAILYHSDLGIYTSYNHMSTLSVSKGESVKKGQNIGKSGDTGEGGPHVHFGIDNDEDRNNMGFDFMPGPSCGTDDSPYPKIVCDKQESEINPACYLPLADYKDLFGSKECSNCPEDYYAAKALC